MTGFLRLIGKISRGEDIAVHKRDGRRTLGGKPVRHIGQVHKSATLAVGGVATVTFTDSSIDATNLTEYTFSTQAIGVAAADRKIVVGAMARPGAAGAMSSMTIGGINASLVVALNSGNQQYELWQADVPTGTTADVVVTWSALKGSCGIGVFRVTGAASAAHNTASSSADPASANLNTLASGVAIGMAGNGANTATFIWTELTEDYDEVVEGGNTHTGASMETSTTQTGLTITCTRSAVSDSPGMVLASWGPA